MWSIFIFVFIAIFKGGKNFLAEIFFAFSLPLLFLKEIYQKKDFFSSTPLNLPLFLFFFLSFLSVGISVHPKVTSNSFFQMVNYLLFFYLLLYSLQKDKKLENRIFLTILFVATLFSFFGIIQFFQGKTARANLANSNLLASFLVPSLGIVLSKLFFNPKLRKKEKIANFLFLFLFGLALFATHSRGGYLSLIFIFTLLLFLKYKRLSLATIPIAVTLLFFIFLPQTYLTTLLKIDDLYSFTRVNIWLSALRASLEKPLFGWGLGSFETIFFRYNFPVEGTIARYGRYPGFVMNEYLQILVELGVAGFFCVIWLIYSFFREIHRKIKESGTWQLYTILLGLSAILTHALVDFNLHLPLIVLTLIFFFTMGIAKSATPIFVTRKVQFFFFFLISFFLLINCANFLSQYYYRKAEKLTNNWEKKIISYKKTILYNPLDSLPHQRLGDLYAERYILTKEEKNKENTIKEYKKAIALEPENAFLYRSLGGFHYDYTENRKLGIFYYEKAIEKNPYNPFFHFELGKIYLNEGLLSQAKGCFQKARELEPNYLQAYFEEGLLWEKGGNHLRGNHLPSNEEKALELYTQILEIIEKNLTPTINYEKKLLQFDYVLLYNQLAGVYFRKGMYSQALFYTEEALKLEPKNKILQQNLKLITEKIKKSKKN